MEDRITEILTEIEKRIDHYEERQKKNTQDAIANCMLTELYQLRFFIVGTPLNVA